MRPAPILRLSHTRRTTIAVGAAPPIRAIAMCPETSDAGECATTNLVEHDLLVRGTELD